MALLSTTVSSFGPVFHLCYYLRGHTDKLSNKVLDFKDNKGAVEKAWQDWVSKELVANKGAIWGTKPDFVIRVLGHDELVCNANRSLSRLGQVIARAIGATFLENVLSKTHITNKFTSLKLAERVKAIEDVYKVADGQDLNGKHVLIIDDVCTSGTSFICISKLIKAKYPRCTVSAFCLAKTNNDNPNINSTITSPF